jgi:guanyl-specific ribonuclease Sa
MCFDASPWGAGGFLIVDGVVRSWFATAFTPTDELAVGMTFGTSNSQQVAEALAILFGLNAWLQAWVGNSPRLQVRSDSVAALTLVARMKTSSPSLAIVAREMALTLSASCVRPCIVEHTPGAANKLADQLSRKYEPGTTWRTPGALLGIAECVLPQRTCGYYRCAGSWEKFPSRSQGAVWGRGM